MDVAELIVEIISSHGEIAGIHIFEAKAAIPLQKRLRPSSDETRMIQNGLQLRSTYNLPFWDSVLLSCFRAKEPPIRLLHAATYHNPSKDAIFIDRNTLTEKYLQNLANEALGNRMLALSSLVKLHDGSQRHLPMLDFHIPISPESLRLVCAVVRELHMGEGFVLETDRSYHFYGGCLLKQDELARFLGRALLFAPIVDRSWIAHQLIESACALRISPRGENGYAPRVVVRINP